MPLHHSRHPLPLAARRPRLASPRRSRLAGRLGRAVGAHPPLRPLQILATLLLVCIAASPTSATRLELRHTTLELPGPAASLLSADVDADTLPDLIVVVASVRWEQIGIEEQVELDDESLVEGVVEVMTVVPALFDRRELFVFLARSEGGYDASLPPLELGPEVLSLERGPDPLAVVALTDAGLSRLVVDRGAGALRLEPFLVAPSVLSHSASFLPRLDLLLDVDGDGELDLLLPSGEEHLLYRAADLRATLGEAEGTGTAGSLPPHARLSLWEEPMPGTVRHVPLPLVRDLDGDGLPELLVRERDGDWREVRIHRNLGEGRFADAVQPFAHWSLLDRGEVGVTFVGNLDGDRNAEVVTQLDLSDPDAGMRKSMREAKVPPMLHRVHRLDASLLPAEAAATEFRSLGYARADGEGEEIPVPGGFQDLDGDGRLDLVSVTLDFSLLQAVRILATRSLSLGMDFHVHCQSEDGAFEAVSGLDLSGKFKLRLDDLRIGQLSQFAGDFDGDGRRDFVQMGRGRDVTIHLGRDGCRYPAAPDLTLRLDEEPKNLALVRIDDYDGDGLSDLVVLQPRRPAEAGVTPTVTVHLYQSAGAGR